MMSEREFIMSQGKLAGEMMEMINKYMYPRMEYKSLWNAEMKTHETYNKMTFGL